MNVKRLLPVLLPAAMALPAYAQDDSGLWAMLEQLESLSDVPLPAQSAPMGGAMAGESQVRWSPVNTLGTGPSPKVIFGGTSATRAGLGLRPATGGTEATSDAKTLDTVWARLRKALQAARSG
jgi:hypothetical protein